MDGEGEVVVAREHGQPGDATGIERRQPRPVDRGPPSEALVLLVQAAEVGTRHVPAQAQGVSTETAEHGRCRTIWLVSKCLSSIGLCEKSHSRGRGFDPHQLHNKPKSFAFSEWFGQLPLDYLF
jgi:hypothetical protein